MASKFPPEGSVLPPPVPHSFTSYVFASPLGIDLSLRIWLPPNDQKEYSSVPWIFWIHGGGWSAGSSYAPPSWLIPAFHAKGIAIVSCDYRLSPHATHDNMIDDCKAGFEYCITNAASLGLDPERAAIGGDSAGGTLATTLATQLLVRVVIDVYGPVDFIALDASSRPIDLTPRDVQLHFGIPESRIRQEWENPDPRQALVAAPFEWELLNLSEEQWRYRYAVENYFFTNRVQLQTALKSYMGPRGLAWRTIFGVVGLGDDEKTAVLRKGSAYHTASKGYPPTAFLHGEADKAVPVSQSKSFAARLRELGTEVIESYEADAPHAFDQIYHGPDVDGWNDYIVPVVEFVARHLGR